MPDSRKHASTSPAHARRPSSHVLSALLSYIGRYKRDALLAPLFVTCEVACEVLVPLVIARIIDDGIQRGNIQVVYHWGIVMALLAAGSLTVGVLAGRFAAHAATGFAANLRQALFASVQRFSFANIDKFSTAGLVTRMTSDVNNVQNAFMTTIRVAVRAPMNLIASLVMCLLISVRLSSVFLVAMVVLIVFVMLVVGPISRLFRQVMEGFDQLNAVTRENITGMRVVKAFVREDYESSRFARAATRLCRLAVRAEGTMATAFPVMMLTVYGCTIALSWFGAHLVVAGSLQTGELTALFTYVMTVLMSLMMLSMVFVMIMMSVASARRIVEVLDEKPGITAPEHALEVVPNGSIDFDHVSFSYRVHQHEEGRLGAGRDGRGEDSAGRTRPSGRRGSHVRFARRTFRRSAGSRGESRPVRDASDEDVQQRQVLIDVNLHIDAGQTIGIVGGTGSGKSTLVSLVSRLYDVDEGSVRVGGHDVRAYDPAALRRQVAVVLQSSRLFTGTIYDNLRWGNEDATDEQCQRACQVACADEFVSQMPDGYDTMVAQGGTNVSGGQRQRLTIARALLKKPKVLILDDSTSAVDTNTDARIRAALADALPGTTKLVIAQRIDSVRETDSIVVLDEGRVVGFGPHDELMNTCDVYREIYETQAKVGADFDAPRPDGWDVGSAMQADGDRADTSQPTASTGEVHR